MTATNVPPLDPVLHSRGGTPDLLDAELAALITNAIEAAPRTVQAELGPSEIGDPCAKRVGYKILHTPEREQPPNWKATVGTAVHAWLADVLDQTNVKLAPYLDGQERFIVETPVDVGHGVFGTVDAYDRITCTVLDWKTCGPAMLKKYQREGPGDEYRIQAHLYGLGLVRAGHPVDTVMVIFLPRQGDLADRYVWHEPYDQELAEAALARYAGIKATVDALGTSALDALPTAPAWCTYCPFLGPCPGYRDPNAPEPAGPVASLSLT